MIFFVAKALIASLLIYLIVSLVLLATQTQATGSSDGNGLDFSGQSDASINSAPLLSYVTRDDSKLNYRRYGKDQGPLIIVIHGSSAHSGLYEELAYGLSKLGTIIVPDLRGHGAHTPSGDVNYIGQLEDDIADLISTVQSNPKQPVILIGHSSGGGLVVRYGGNPKQPKVDGVVLLAPYLGHNAPTTRVDSGGWAQPLTRRIIGLTMLNALRIKLLNHLTVISFELPDDSEALQMTAEYSYRMNVSFAPRYDFKKDIAGLPTFIILIGENDEAFRADKFEPLLSSFDNQGSVHILDGLTHLDVIGDNSTHKQIATFVLGLSERS